MIDLDKCNLIGKGRDRAVYEHPDNPKLCIKVAIKKEKQSKRERTYIEHLKQKKTDLTGISLYRGSVVTTLGTGHLFDLVREENGSVGKTLKEMIDHKNIDNGDLKNLTSRIVDYLYSQNICVYDLSPKNIVIIKSKNKDWKFKIIDGLGVANSNPFVVHSSFLTRKLLDKSVARLKTKINKAIKYRDLNTLPPQKKRKTFLIKHAWLILIISVIATLTLNFI